MYGPYCMDHTTCLIKISIAIENMHLDDDDSEPVTEVEDIDEPVVLELVNSGETGAILATPTQNEAGNSKKRKQPTITQFFVKKQIIEK